MSRSDQLSHSNTVAVWGVPLVPWTMERTIEEIEGLIASGQPHYFMTINLHTAMLAHEHPGIKSAVDGAAFALADGMPLVWVARLHGDKLPGRVAGSDLFPLLCEKAAVKGYRLFFLGGPPGVGEAAAAKLSARFPGLQVVGIESPPFRTPTPEEEEALLQRIRDARPHLLFVAYGQPKGELWVQKNSPALSGIVCAQIGGSLDFAAGRINRAPLWMQRIGLEWFYRLSREPRRLFGRYSRNALFILRMLATDLVRKPRQRPVR